MGFIDKLLFWRKKTVEIETDIEGCFTLPGADLDQMADRVENPVTGDGSVDDASELEGEQLG